MVEVPTVIAVNLGVLAFLAGWAWRGAFDGIRALRSERNIGRSLPDSGRTVTPPEASDDGSKGAS